MIGISDIERAISDTSLRLFSTYSEPSYFEKNLIEVGEGTLEELVEFATLNDVKSLQYMIRGVDEEAFKISEEEVRTTKIPEELHDEIWNNIEAYNNEVAMINFDRPYSIIIYCLHESHVFGIIDYDLWFEEEQIPFPSDKLDLILEDYKTKIEEERRLQKKREEELIQEFRDKLFSNPEFLKCSNKQRRDNYVSQVFKRPEFEKYKRAFDPRDGKFYVAIAKTYVDAFWSEYRNSRKS